MSATGRPLRFFAIVLGGWVAARVYLLWPAAPIPVAAHAAMPGHLSSHATPANPGVQMGQPGKGRHVASPVPSPRFCYGVHGRARAGDVDGAAPWIPEQGRGDEWHFMAVSPPELRVFRKDKHHAPSRLSLSAWATARAGGTSDVSVPTPQLGGGQAGARIAYLLDSRHDIALAARVSSAIGAQQRDAAIGVEWRPARLPLRIVAERRIGITGIRGGFALGAIGGIDEALAPGLRITGYAQAGVIARMGAEGYADGAVRISRAVGAIDLGLGAWGAAQRGAARLDIGPTAGIAIPVGPRRARLALDWRQRIAGHARPSSGPALSIGIDF